jgi:hypothetical protein
MMEREEANYLEHGLDNIYLTSDFQQKSIVEKANVCVEIVKAWLELYTEQEKESFNSYVQHSYWLLLLTSEDLSYEHWETFFQNDNYRRVDVSSEIPDDPVQRLVFHFVYDWKTKFKIFFLDNEVENQQKVNVLRKQLENILYIYQRRLHGNTWRMLSLPDKILKQALFGARMHSTIFARHIFPPIRLLRDFLPPGEGMDNSLTKPNFISYQMFPNLRQMLLGGCFLAFPPAPNLWREALKMHYGFGDGDAIPITGDDGDPLKFITGQTLTASASQGISKDSADGPKPDDLDKKLFNDVLQYAKNSYPNLKLDSWTLIRASFKYEDDGEKKEVRCYAFSGVSEDKRQIPSEWWKSVKHNNFYLEEDRDIFVPVVDANQLGPNLVMSIFSACRPFYEEDLLELTMLIAFEQQEESQFKILKNRKDLKTLDYGEYYDIVMREVSRSVQIIMKRVFQVLQLPYHPHDIEERFGELFQKLTCGSENPKFTPSEDGLDVAILNAYRLSKAKDIPESAELLKLTKRVAGISSKILSELKLKLEKLPSSYLDNLEKRLKPARCGEDNVLSFLSGTLIQNVETFLPTRVKFVALDQADLDGKPFCSRCDRKVRFFSICPSILRSLGVTGNDDDLLKKLQELFIQMNM